MTSRTCLAALLASVALLAGGCASSGTAPTTVKDTSGCPTTLSITATDGSKSLCVAVGGSVTVHLAGTGGPWKPIEITGNNLQISGTPSVPAQGAQTAAFTAKSAGTAVLTSSHPACPNSPGVMSCNAIALWKVTITVK